MSCDLGPIDIYECTFCKCQFEAGVAGVNAAGDPRCPDCGAYTARSIAPEEIGAFVVMRWNGFG